MARTPSDINGGHDYGQADSGVNVQVISADGPVQVPDTGYITDSEMVRDGQDLVLTTDDGVVVIENYFLAEPAPQIISPQGTVLTPELVHSFARSPAEYAQKGSLTDASPVGSVQEVSGDATVTRTDGSTETIRTGTPIFEGDIVETGTDGAVNIVFIDETSFAVSDNARLAIDEYVFDPLTESGSTDFSVLRGVFVFTSGLIGRDDPDDVEINTPVGSIGIRGTMIAGNVDSGEITVIEGAIVMRTHNGVEMTLADQFASAKFDPGSGGIVSMGQMAPSDLGARYASITKVSPVFSNSLGNPANNDGGEEGGADQDLQGEGEAEAPEEGEGEGPEAESGNPEEAAGEENAGDAGEETGEEAAAEDGTEGEPVEGEPVEAADGPEAAVPAADGVPESDAPAVEGTEPLPPPPPPTSSEADNVAGTGSDTGESLMDPPPSSDQPPAGQPPADNAGANQPPADQPPADNSGNEPPPPPPPFELEFHRFGLDDVPEYGDEVAGIRMTHPGYYSQVQFTLDSADSNFELVQVDGSHAYIRYIGESNVNLDGTAYSFSVTAYAGDGLADSISFNVVAGDMNNVMGPPAIDLASGNAGGVMELNLNMDATEMSLSSVGDTDGDGISEVAVIAEGTDGYLYTRIYEGNDPNASLIYNGGTAANLDGLNAAGIGDINGDGHDEYIIGTPSSGNYSEAVVHGENGSVLVNIPGAVYTGHGQSVAGLGDVNNDGYADFAVSDIEGHVYLHYGKADPAAAPAPDHTFYSGDPSYGHEISAGGDFNGDGASDIIIGSPEEQTVYIQSYDNAVELTILTITGPNLGGLPEDNFGHGVLGGFDINGDNYDDVVIAAGDDAYVVYGGNFAYGHNIDLTGGIAAADGFQIAGDISDVVNGAVAGDFNGDGYDDLVMVTSTLDANNVYINDIYVIYGGTDHIGSGRNVVNVGEMDDDNIDSSQYVFQIIWDGTDINGDNIEVSAAGDLDGDGFDDLLIGSSDTDQVFVVYGRPAFGSLEGDDPLMHASGHNHDSAMDIIASSDGDSLVGDAGNNVLRDGGAFNLSMRGGGGDDIFVVNVARLDATVADNHRALDGGSGTDTLQIGGAGSIDFSGVGNLESIEHIDMTNGKANTIVLTMDEIFGMARDEYQDISDYGGNSAYVLTIDGDAGDHVDLTNQGFYDGTNITFDGYTGYINASGTHMVLVDTDVTVQTV